MLAFETDEAGKERRERRLHRERNKQPSADGRAEGPAFSTGTERSRVSRRPPIVCPETANKYDPPARRALYSPLFLPEPLLPP